MNQSHGDSGLRPHTLRNSSSSKSIQQPIGLVGRPAIAGPKSVTQLDDVHWHHTVSPPGRRLAVRSIRTSSEPRNPKCQLYLLTLERKLVKPSGWFGVNCVEHFVPSAGREKQHPLFISFTGSS